MKTAISVVVFLALSGIAVLFILFNCGCVGTGFNKETTLMPDEVGVSVDANPQEGWRVDRDWETI